MLAIRLQRTGRKGLPMYRVIVQEAHRQPTSGRVVANLGHYNPHTKAMVVDKAQAETYLKNGAQPSDRVVKLFTQQKITLPDWVKQPVTDKQKAIKNTEKLRRNRPEDTPAEAATETEEASAGTPAAEAAPEAVEVETSTVKTPVETPDEAQSAEETTVEAGSGEVVKETPAAEKSEEAPKASAKEEA